MPLALDYRPQTLKELAGNTSLKKSLGGILQRPLKEIPHAMLFTGLSGGGKTTCAGIVANHLKCDPNEITEVNSANFRGIDTARELDRVLRYPPMRGQVRIWVLNEVHQWLAPVQNAMLDILEKAPAYAFFILTTTDPQKLITPLRKRCVEFEVLPLTDDEMFDMLVGVVEAEKSDVPDNILDNIIAVANGSSRNALQLLEKVIDLDVKDMATVAMKFDDEEKVTKDLIDKLLKKRPWKEVATVLKNITAEQETIRIGIRNYCAAILLNGTDNKQAALIIACMDKPMYETGKAAITAACYDVICG